jgi:mannose-6-phosphate isomerase-like protein (cupin superfamily)
MGDYTVKSIEEVADAAAGMAPDGQAQVRFAAGDFGAADTGFAHHRYAAGIRQPFGHRHDAAEEVYVVIDGSGRVRLDDEIVEVSRLDAIRVAPEVVRCFEAGPDGLEFIVFGPRHEGDGELLNGWWTD